MQYKELLDNLEQALTSYPLLAKDVLKTVTDAQEAYQAKLQKRRSSEASNTISDLISIVMNPGQFKKFSKETQKIWARRAIAYHFPDGNVNGYSYSQVEKNFFEKYSGAPPLEPEGEGDYQ